MIKEIIILENFIEKTLLKDCINNILSCEIKSANESFYMNGEDRKKM
jgi:hypothetical protein